jgi:hypothetical protein
MENNCDKSDFKLIIRRKAKLTGAALKTRIIINDVIRSSVTNNKKVEFNLPRKYTKVRLYNKVPLGRDIVKEIVIDPLINSTVEIRIYYKMNWLTLIPPLTFLIPTSSIKTEIKYFKD